ncbi:MAG: DNA polymerase III subunit alpha [Clostridia bacterium]
MAEEPGVLLHVHSAFSFLDGASLPEDLVAAAAARNIGTMALTDTHRLSGLILFLKAAMSAGIKPVAGATVRVAGDAGVLVLLVPGPDRYPQLTRLLTHAHVDHPRGEPVVEREALMRWGPGLVALSGGRRGILDRLIYQGRLEAALREASWLKGIFGASFFLEVGAGWLPGDRAIRTALQELAERLTVPLVAAPEVHYAYPEDFPLYDLLVAVRHGLRVEEPHPDRPLNAEGYVKSTAETARALGSLAVSALRGAAMLAERLHPPDLLGKARMPRFGADPDAARRELEALTWAGARHRYGKDWRRAGARIRHELRIITDLGFQDYFLAVEDVARYARAAGIRFAGRGSAADSVVAYCLGITHVDALARDLLFERFLSRERAETPDIDLDFDARRRDEVADYVRQRYGAEHVAAVATYQTFRARLALRQVGKVLGFPAAELDELAKSLPPRPLLQAEAAWEEVPELRELHVSPKARELLIWAARAEGIPRHIGTHLGGLVISSEPLLNVTPLETSAKGIQLAQFDKRDVEDLGLLKLDLLSLRTFTALTDTVATIRRGEPDFDDDRLPPADPAVYRRLQAADSIGTFQLESPAQRALARRLQPDRYEDIVASLALIRPGPIKGNMVDPFVARRRGEEPVRYPHPALEPILRKTFGVVLFQEQVIAIASQLAGFTPGEADQLRRVMTHARSTTEMERLGTHFRQKAIARGISEQVAEEVFQQMVGYASYGFNEAHAAAFAETAYRTVYILDRYPGPYLTGLLNAEPMGFYPLDVLVTEARRRGIAILPVDIERSEGPFRFDQEVSGIRIGLRAVKGLEEKAAEGICEARLHPSRNPLQILERAGIRPDLGAALIRVGAFDRLRPDREHLLGEWLFANPLGLERTGSGRPWSLTERLYWEYQILGFGQTAQAMTLFRPTLDGRGFLTAAAAGSRPDGDPVRVAGVPVRPHRPPTRSGRLIVFFSLLDETGLLDASMNEERYRRFGHLLFSAQHRGPLAAVGRMRQGTLMVTALGPWPPAPSS